MCKGKIMGFNFGVNWDAKDSVQLAFEEEEIQRQALAKKEAQGKKMTPTQKRDALYRQITQALQNDEPSQALDILKDNPKLVFDKKCDALDDLSKAVLDYFDIDLARDLLNKGFYFPHHPISSSLLKNKNDDLFDFVAHDMAASHNKTTRKNSQIILNSIQGRFIDVFMASTPQSKKRLLRHYIKKINPGYCQDKNMFDFISPYSIRSVFLCYDKNSLPEEKSLLEICPQGHIKESLKNIFTNMTVSITATQLKSIMLACEEIDAFSKGLDVFLNEIKNDYTLEKSVDNYFEKGKPFEQTKAFDLLSNQHNKMFYQNKKLELQTDFDNVLGLDAHQAVLSHGYFNPDYMWNAISASPAHKKGFSFPPYMPKNIVECLVSQASPAISALWKTSQGIDLFNQSILKPSVLISFIRKSTLDQINKALKLSSCFKDFKDDFGNNIAHYIVFARHEKTKSCVMMLSRHNHNWLTDVNDKGVGIKDLLERNKADVSVLTFVDKEAIRKSIKNDKEGKSRRNTIKRKSRAM